MAAKASSIGVNPSGLIKICKTCKIPFYDIYVYAEHLESKEHVKEIMKNKYGKNFLAAKAELKKTSSNEKSETSFEMLNDCQEKVKKPSMEISKSTEKPFESSVTSNGKGSSSGSEDSDEGEVYTCIPCEKVCTGLISFKLHLEGKKHKKTLRKMKIVKQMEAQKMIPVSTDEPKEDNLFERMYSGSRHVSPNFDCTPCNKKRLGPEAYKQHCKSDSHKKKVELEKYLNSTENEDVPLVKVQDGRYARCDRCNKSFSGPLPYMQHMESESHLKQVHNAREVDRIKDDIVKNEEDSKFHCKKCGKMFSGPVPFNVHMNSSAHEKMKKKIDLMDELEKNNPDLIKIITAEKYGDSEEDDIVLLGCKACRISLSGPENANEHFASPRHKKSLRNNKAYEKFKQQLRDGKLIVFSDGTKTRKQSESDDSSHFEEEFDIVES